MYYDEEKISEYGKSILDTTYVYNPSEFQMNTAFAKAFTIDNIGTKGNIKVNGFYIESSFLEIIKGIDNINLKFTPESINIHFKNKLMFKLLISDNFKIDLKGIIVRIYHIGEFQILKEFDGEEINVSLFR